MRSHFSPVKGKPSWTALRMSRPLFVGSDLQVTWWALGQRKEKFALNDNEFYLHEDKKKNHFHINGLALGFALKQRLVATRKWPTFLGPAGVSSA